MLLTIRVSCKLAQHYGGWCYNTRRGVSVNDGMTNDGMGLSHGAYPKTNEGHVCLDTSYWLQARYCYKGPNKVEERVANWQIHEDKPTAQKVLPNRWQHGKGESRLHEIG